MTFDLDSVDLFPEVNEKNHPKSGMSIKEWSLLELGLTRMAAAAALAGDAEMGRALSSALSPLIEFHMTRWPKVEVAEEVSKATSESPLVTPGPKADINESGMETAMQNENTGGENMGQAGTGQDTTASADRDENLTRIDQGGEPSTEGQAQSDSDPADVTDTAATEGDAGEQAGSESSE